MLRSRRGIGNLVAPAEMGSVFKEVASDEDTVRKGSKQTTNVHDDVSAHPQSFAAQASGAGLRQTCMHALNNHTQVSTIRLLTAAFQVDQHHSRWRWFRCRQTVKCVDPCPPHPPQTCSAYCGLNVRTGQGRCCTRNRAASRQRSRISDRRGARPRPPPERQWHDAWRPRAVRPASQQGHATTGRQVLFWCRRTRRRVQ